MPRPALEIRLALAGVDCTARAAQVPRSRKEPLMANPFVHVELHTNDLAKAKAFYTKLFGWKLQDMPMPGGGTYTMLDVGEGTGGGMMTAQPPGSPPRWQAYVGVDDVAAATRKAKE